MSEPRVRVSRRLYLAALADAIDWTQSLVEGHNGERVSGTGCCDRGTRCQAYKDGSAQLNRYRKARAAILGPEQPEAKVPTITLHELAARYQAQT